VKVAFSDTAAWEMTRKISIFIEIMRPRLWPRGFAEFGDFTAYLADESRRFLNGQGIDATFFQQADLRFPPDQASVYLASASDWIMFVRCVLDQQFALTFNWLMTSARHPRAVIHDLKREVQMLIAGQQPGQAISNKEIEQFQNKTLNAVAQMDQMLKTEIFGGDSPAIDVGVAVERFIAQVREKFTLIDFHKDIAPEIYVEIQPKLLESVVLNLLHNAITAASSSGVASWISIVIAKLDVAEQGQPQMLLKLANPYDPKATGTLSGTGIGLVAVHHIIEKLNHGHVFEIPHEDSRVYEVGVMLPLVGHE
jgi:signal transduction histidine kinase